jgi:dephospho-CoA kinase
MSIKKRFLKIGVTGGIGSGKSTVCSLIEKFGYPVFYSDLEAKNLMNSNKALMDGIKVLFGNEAYLNGVLNRIHLAKVAFNNQSVLSDLNNLVHPLVRKEFELFCLRNVHKKLIFNEAAILFESGAYKSFDYNILVCANEELRIQRVSERDNVSVSQVKERLKNQWSDDQKVPLADFVVSNNNEALKPQIEQVIEAIKAHTGLL